jgi:hypothetical protein
MVPVELVQSALVNYLLTQPPVVAIVGAEVREDEWQGADFVYPCIRVGIDVVTPRLCFDDFSLTVMAFSVEASSRQAAVLCSTLWGVLKDVRIHHGLLRPEIAAGLVVGFNSLRLYVKKILGPYRAPPRAWRGDLICWVSCFECPK